MFSYSDIHHKFDDHEYILDTTPMSVSDVLSPMSVDRSQSAVKIFDDSNSKDVAESTEDDKHLVPRNDRQRFFEVVEYQRSILEYFRESEVGRTRVWWRDKKIIKIGKHEGRRYFIHTLKNMFFYLI